MSREVYPPLVNTSDGQEHLYFGLMMSLGGAQDSSGMVPAVQVALDLINNSSLLTGYTLHYVLYDSQVYSISRYTLLALSRVLSAKCNWYFSLRVELAMKVNESIPKTLLVS